MKRKTIPGIKRFVSAALSILMLCGNFVFSALPIYALDDNTIVYLQDLYKANPSSVTVVGNQDVIAQAFTIGFTTGNIEYKKALRQDTVDNKHGQEESSMTFSLTDLNLSGFGGEFVADCVMVIGDNSNYPLPDAIFKVYIDDKLVAQSGVVSYKNSKVTLSCYVPGDAETIRLATDCYDDTACDWCVWGDPRIVPRKDAKFYLTSLSPVEKNKVQTGYGSYELRYANTSSQVFTRSIYNHAGRPGAAFASVSYDVEYIAKNGAVFKSYIGFLKNNPGEDTNKYGRASFLVYADDVLLTRSEEITVDSPLTALEISIPAGTKTLKLAQDPGTSQSCDWCLWGDPCIYQKDVAVLNAELDRDVIPLGETGTIRVWVCNGGGEPVENAEYTAVFESSDTNVAAAESDGTITAKGFGKADIICTAEYNGKTINKTFPIIVTAGAQTIYLADINSEHTGEYTLRYDDTGRLDCAKGIYIHAGRPGQEFSSASYDVSSYTASNISFHSYIGFLATNGNEIDTGMKGLASFAVYADGREIAKSEFISPKSKLSRMDVLVPKGTKSLKIALDPGEKQDFDWCLWGDPYLAVDSDYQNRLASAALSAEKTELEVGETQKLSLTAMLASGNPAPLSESVVKYESSNPEVLSVSEDGVVKALNDGSAFVTATVNYNASEASATLRFRCGKTVDDIVRYLGELSPESSSIGWGSLVIDRDLAGNKIHFAGENGGITCDRGLMTHAPSELVYDIERYGAFAFRAVVGITDDEAPGKGLVQFFVYADDTLLYQSEKLTNNGPYETIDVLIPSETKKLRLVADKCGDIASDHSAWGNANIVLEPQAAKNVVYAKAVLSRPVLVKEQNANITVSGLFADGSTLDGSENITYQSENPDFFTVDDNGVVTAVSDGTGYVAVTIHSGNIPYTTKIRVIVGQSETDTLYHFASPDNSRTFIMSIDDGKPFYTLIDGSDTVIESASFGIITDKADFSDGLAVKEVSAVKYIEDTYTLTAHTKEQYSDPCNERSFTYTKDGAEMTVIVRLYNDGMALRYVISSPDGTDFSIKDEATSVTLPQNATVWAMAYTPNLEGMYGAVSAGYITGKYYSLPILAKNGEKYVLMTETGINPEMSGTRAYGVSNGIQFTPVEKNTTVSSPFSSTWRVIVEGTLAEVTESSLVTAVAGKPDESIDYSFVEPGISAWSWDEVHFAGQADPAVHKQYIDYAAEMGWKYYTLDYGWHKPDGEVRDGNYKVLPGVHYDWVQEVIDYAESKGVKLIGWVHRVNLEDEAKMNAILEDYKDMGLAGIKADFFDSESRATMEIYDRLYRKCAELGLIVNCHGANKPTGEVRSYPNAIAREAIKGDEYAFYDGMSASQYTIIPFLRAVTGPAEVTEYIYPRRTNKMTCGSQIALSVLVTSGLHSMGTPPEKMLNSPARYLYQNFPSVFDDSFLMEGEVGEYAMLGRRSGSVFYAAGITEKARTVSFKLDFLNENETYFAEIYKDGEDKGTLKTETRLVRKNDAVAVDFLENGGALLRLTPVSELIAPDSITLSESNLTMSSGGKATVKVETSGNMTPGALLYTSSNEEVARFENGTVYAVGAGIATIRVSSAKDSNVYAECRVYVKREENAVSAITVNAPEKVEANERFTVAFDAQSGVSIEELSLVDDKFGDITIYSREEKDGKYIFTVSVPYGEKIGILNECGKEIGFFEVSTRVSIFYDGIASATAYSGESITLAAEKISEPLLFVGWKIGDTVYAADITFAVPFGVSELFITSVFTDPNETVNIYIDAENGNDSVAGLTVTTAVKTVSRAFELLNSYSAKEKVLTVVGKLSPERNMPINNTVITVKGYNEDSVWNVGADGIAMNGDLNFENIRLETSCDNKFLDTMGHKLHIGDRVVTEFSPVKVIIHSGTMNQNGPRESVTIDSGSFSIYAGAFYNVSKPDETNGADYTINGGTVSLIFYADTFSNAHHGAVFTDDVVLTHNGGTLTVKALETNGQPVLFNKSFTLIQNNGAQTVVTGFEELCNNGYYVVASEKFGGCYVTGTSEEGIFAVTADEGINAFADKNQIFDTFTAQSGKTVYVSYRPDKAACIGGTLYDSISDAFADSAEGDTVVLLNHAVLDENIMVPSGVKVDFDGFSVKGSKFILNVGAEAYNICNISDGVAANDNYFLGISGTEKLYSAHGADVMAKQNNLYFDDAEYTVAEKDGVLTAAYELNGKTYSITAEASPETVLYASNIVYCGGSVKAWYANGNQAKLTVNGGEIATIYAGGNDETDSVSITINGGTVSTLYASGIGKTNTVLISICSGTVKNLYKTAPNGIPAENLSVVSSGGKIFTGWDSTGKAIFITADLIGMQLRISGVQGLRFIAEIRGDYQNSLSEYGLVVLPEFLLSGAELTLETPHNVTISSNMSNFKIYAQNEDSIQYTACITDIAPKNYDRRYCVRAYIKYSDADGEHTVYTDTMTGDILTTVKGLRDQYPGNYDDLYERLNAEYSATFVSAGEFRKKVQALSSEGTYQKLSLDYSVKGKALNSVGAETANADWNCTDYIALSDYTVLQYCLSTKSSISSLAFYDENKQYISGMTSSGTVGSDGYAIAIYQETIPSNAAYVRFSNHEKFALSSAILSYDIGSQMNEYCITKDATSFAGKKILCVGDSLTYGDYGTTVPGRGYPHNENYPYYLALYTGASVEWYARGGYTATQLYNDYHDGIFSGAGRPGEYSAKDADYVIVMLGTNAGLTLNGTGHYDSYCRLIEKLKKDMKAGAKLILMTPPHATEDTSKVNYGYAPNVVNAYAAVYELAKIYDLPVFDAYYDSGLSEQNEELMQPNDGLHFGGVGYSTFAAFVNNELKLLNSGKLGVLTAQDENDIEDAAFLSTVKYPSFELCDGKYKTFGRWFKKTVDGTICDVTTTSGSQIFFMTNGASCFTVDFRDETKCATSKPYYAVSIDGNEPVRYPITQNTVMLPDSSRHVVWMIMDGMYEWENKWNGEVGFAVSDISINSGVMRAVMPKNDIVFYYGDSITEGVNALGTTTNGASNSATHSYVFYSAKKLSAIPYYIGYGASGLVRPGSFKEMATAMEKLSATKNVDMSVKPSKIVINHGYNDAYFNANNPAITSEEFSAALNKTLNRLNELYNDTPIYYFIPINQKYTEEIRAAANRYSNLSVIESASIEIATLDGIHPNAASAENMGNTLAESIMKAENRTHVFDSYITYASSLQNTAKKLHDDKKLTVAYFGGSVTAGYGASDFDTGGNATDKNSWRAKTTAWLKETYPDASIESIYAAIGESGTYLGTYIVQDYVIAKAPDLVFIEYAINDTYGGFDKTRAALQLETIVREIETALPKTDIVILLSGDQGRLSGNTWYFPTAEGHAEIAEHYDLPLVYMGRALYDHIQKDSLSWSTFYKDNVHPLDAGYAYYFEVVKEYLRNALLCTCYEDKYAEHVLPALYSDYLLDGERTLVYATEELLDGNSGWSRSNSNINPVFSRKGSIVQTISNTMTPFTYTFNGTELAIYTNLYAPAQYELTVDGEYSVRTFSGSNPTTVVTGLSSGAHTVTIKPIADTVSSNTTVMQIDAVMFRDETKQTEKNPS